MILIVLRNIPLIRADFCRSYGPCHNQNIKGKPHKFFANLQFLKEKPDFPVFAIFENLQIFGNFPGFQNFKIFQKTGKHRSGTSAHPTRMRVGVYTVVYMYCDLSARYVHNACISCTMVSYQAGWAAPGKNPKTARQVIQ